MTRSERVREFIVALRNTHCVAARAAAGGGYEERVARHTMTAEALLAVEVLLTHTFDLEPLDFAGK